MNIEGGDAGIRQAVGYYLDDYKDIRAAVSVLRDPGLSEKNMNLPRKRPVRLEGGLFH